MSTSIKTPKPDDEALLPRHQRVLDAYAALPGDSPEPPVALDAAILGMATAAHALGAGSAPARQSSVQASRRRRRWPFVLPWQNIQHKFVLASAASLAMVGFAALLARQQFLAPDAAPAARTEQAQPQGAAAPTTPAAPIADAQAAAAAAAAAAAQPSAQIVARVSAADVPQPLSAPTHRASVQRSAAPSTTVAEVTEVAPSAAPAFAADAPGAASAISPVESEVGAGMHDNSKVADSFDQLVQEQLAQDQRQQLELASASPEAKASPESASESAPAKPAPAKPETADPETAVELSAVAAAPSAELARDAAKPVAAAAPATPAPGTAAGSSKKTESLDATAHAKTFAQIRALLNSRERAKAKAMLLRLVKAYPEAVIPADLKPLIGADR